MAQTNEKVGSSNVNWFGKRGGRNRDAKARTGIVEAASTIARATGAHIAATSNNNHQNNDGSARNGNIGDDSDEQEENQTKIDICNK